MLVEKFLQLDNKLSSKKHCFLSVKRIVEQFKFNSYEISGTKKGLKVVVEYESIYHTIDLNKIDRRNYILYMEELPY